MQGREAPPAVMEQDYGILGRTPLSGNWHGPVPGAQGRTPWLQVLLGHCACF